MRWISISHVYNIISIRRRVAGGAEFLDLHPDVAQSQLLRLSGLPVGISECSAITNGI
jgi:hypothetical protein